MEIKIEVDDIEQDMIGNTLAHDLIYEDNIQSIILNMGKIELVDQEIWYEFLDKMNLEYSQFILG